MQLGPAAGDVKLTLQGQVGRLAGDDYLADDRLGRPGRSAKATVVGRHVTPGQHGQPLFGQRRTERILATLAQLGVRRAEHHAHAVRPGSGQLDTERIRRPREQGMGNLQEHARPVAGGFIAPGRAAMAQVGQHAPRDADDLMVGPAVDTHHGADAARVVFAATFVQPNIRDGLMRHRCHSDVWPIGPS